MTRRRNTESASADDFFDIVVDVGKTLPWWFTVPTAILLVVFVPVPDLANATRVSEAAVTGMFLFALALVLKYLVPLALLIGSVISFTHSFKSGSLFKSISLNGARQTLESLSWQDFEFLLAEWFKKEGFAVEAAGGPRADGGVDIRLRKEGELYVVQCKHYRVSVNVIRELYGVMGAEAAVGGYVVTSGKFTKAAKAFAAGKNIVLLDGDSLARMLDQETASDLAAQSVVKNFCPRCGNELVVRNGRRGRFWGCTGFPKCRYTADL